MKAKIPKEVFETNSSTQHPLLKSNESDIISKL